MDIRIVILAAGLGVRMRSKQAKVLHRAGGLTLIEHVVRAARALTPADHVTVVTGHQAAEVEELLRPQGVRFARQRTQRGTAHAVACCRQQASRSRGLLMVLYGDTPLLSSTTLEALRDAHLKSRAAATLIATTVTDPNGYGRVITDDDGYVAEIVEDKDCTPAQREIRMINSGIYCFRADLLWSHLKQVRPNRVTGEYYLTDLARILRRCGHAVCAMHQADSSELFGVNTRVELAEADRILRMRKARELMLAGVTIESPETVAIDADVSCGQDTVIEPFSRLLGRTEVGENCRIGAGAILDGSAIGDGAIVAPYTVIAGSRIDPGASVGPFARLRMGAHVGPDARVGNFVELKNTHLGAGAKSQHLAYLGDSRIGDGTNIGAGTITCNYDGVSKNETHIGERAFIGSNATLVAPLEIADGAYIGAGSVITDSVPPGALALGRARQVVKPGWAQKRRAAKGSKR
ncbi:MAG TPA: bifunctional UDP-N-acetylglucosamine diphosphorylase/glucosamine-1-phosphate N-acetyltransferase GlmU [Bryobacteraceae bacterium]|nr:bifunctional UDP-N-acetylglucosamine diphosphorylase/glucosamine-1-phosphate N-acetyltransferase GlmU [Bryobacteraceae bacterium]